jgi:hypothetical protein
MGVENVATKFPKTEDALQEKGAPHFTNNNTLKVETYDGVLKTIAFKEDLPPSQGGDPPLFVDGEQPLRIGDLNTELHYQTQNDFIGLQVFIQGKLFENGVDLQITSNNTFKIIFQGLVNHLPLGPEDKGYAFKVYYRYTI